MRSSSTRSTSGNVVRRAAIIRGRNTLIDTIVTLEDFDTLHLMKGDRHVFRVTKRVWIVLYKKSTWQLPMKRAKEFDKYVDAKRFVEQANDELAIALLTGERKDGFEGT